MLKLPQKGFEFLSITKNKIYYYDPISDVGQWSRLNLEYTIKLPPNWNIVISQAGKIYFHNNLTRENQYKIPENTLVNPSEDVDFSKGPENLIQTKDSFLKLAYFPDQELLKKCVLEVTNILTDYPAIKIFGKTCQQRRCVGFFSNESKGYKYSNQLALSKPLSKSMLLLLNKINLIFKTNYNGILVNKYKTGEDYISAHSDDEKNLDDTGVVAISYGATRIFRIRDKQTKKIIKNLELPPYSMVQMGGKFQEEFTHEVPIQKKIKNERISFTFRKHID